MSNLKQKIITFSFMSPLNRTLGHMSDYTKSRNEAEQQKSDSHVHEAIQKSYIWAELKKFQVGGLVVPGL